MQMTGWPGQRLWAPQPGLLVLLVAKEVSSSAKTRAGAGLGEHQLVFTPSPLSFSSSQPWPCLDLDNRGRVPWHRRGLWPFLSSSLGRS